MASKAKLEANERYLKKLDNIIIRVEKGKRNKIKAFAESKGLSLNSYITELMQTDMGEFWED